MTHYNYRCYDCGSKFSISEIEDNLQYLCPNCGKSEKNSPLKGILLIEYDFEQLKSVFKNKETLTKRFDQLCDLRNAIRHSRSVDEIIRKEGEASIVWFKKILNN